MPFLTTGFHARRFAVLFVAATLLFLAFRQLAGRGDLPPPSLIASAKIRQPIKWADLPPRYPVTSTIALPTGTSSPIPHIQHEFGVETEHNKDQRTKRLAAVQEAFAHSWEGYKQHAWLQDEVTPVTGGYKNGFGQRAATLIDTLDTLIIMGLEDEFEMALKEVKKIDFSTSGTPTLNVFETTIRYLGGLLSAYDLSDAKHHVLLDKAIELGEMLYGAFDTPNRLPITRWDWASGALKGDQQAPNRALSAELGSLSLEFTRLSQLSGDPKYFDAIQRITNKIENQQSKTAIPGLIPIVVNIHDEDFTNEKTFTFGGMSDSLYEYLPKQYLLLDGRLDQYRTMYERAIEAGKKHLFFRPLNPANQDILISGTTRMGVSGTTSLQAEGQHLTCFAGGMVGIGAKIFNRTEELDVARKLVEGCIWAYDSTPTGIMPETFKVYPCPSNEDCAWNIEKWHDAVLSDSGSGREMDVADIILEDQLPPGFTNIGDPRFLLRPEAIESVFILYRITGDPSLQDAAWRMFSAIKNATWTDIAHSAIADVLTPQKQDTLKLDECESFWFGETLKYFYLIFSEPSAVSLDEWVFNTEAHPLRRPQKKNKK